MESSTPTLAPTHQASFDCEVVPESVYLEVLGDVSDALEGRFRHAFIGGLASRGARPPALDLRHRRLRPRRGCERRARRARRTRLRDRRARPGLDLQGDPRRRAGRRDLPGARAVSISTTRCCERSAVHDFRGVPIRVISPEDLIVFKAAAHKENRARDWHDALGVISRSRSTGTTSSSGRRTASGASRASCCTRRATTSSSRTRW